MISNIYSSIQLSADRWLEIYECLCISVINSEGEKQKRLIILKEVMGNHLISLMQRDIPVKE